MKPRLITFLASGFCFIAIAAAQTKKFPASRYVGIGTTRSTLLHFRAGGSITPSYPSSTTQEDIFSLIQADNNAMELGVGKGTDAWNGYVVNGNMGIG
ncbi:hypothetical protein ACFQRK_22890 [Parapedobacter sp. GCM10030251]|uniref:hypothetical protein n=1 Tax=Parapedobacter sp. GCM10030251 TaxID=3273419 RepID=UPI0036114D5C